MDECYVCWSFSDGVVKTRGILPDHHSKMAAFNFVRSKIHNFGLFRFFVDFPSNCLFSWWIGCKIVSVGELFRFDFAFMLHSGRTVIDIKFIFFCFFLFFNFKKKNFFVLFCWWETSSARTTRKRFKKIWSDVGLASRWDKLVPSKFASVCHFTTKFDAIFPSLKRHNFCP